MGDDKSIGFTKEEYYKLSSKQGLPKRCPILRKCSRAILTRYEMGFKLGGSKITFDEFLQSEGQSWEPEKMIKEVESISWRYAHDVLKSVENVCPEVSLFEPDYLPFNFKQSAFGNGSYYKDTRRFEAEPKHYSECAEYSEYTFQASRKKNKGLGAKKSLNQIPEKKLEDYLTNNIEALELSVVLGDVIDYVDFLTLFPNGFFLFNRATQFRQFLMTILSLSRQTSPNKDSMGCLLLLLLSLIFPL